MESGVDRSLEYRRYPLRECPKWSKELPSRHYWFTNVDLQLHVIGFCGKIYPFFEIRRNNTNPNSKEGRSKIKFAFSIQDIDSFFKSQLPDCFEDYMENKPLKGSRHGYSIIRRDFIREFESFDKNRDRFSSHFDEEKIPVFFSRHQDNEKDGRQVEWNARLVDYEFHRVIDSYQAFQQIAMWLANQAVPIKPIPKISNDDMIESKGFDLKFSFRKPKSN